MSLVWEFGVGGVGGSGEQERVLQGSEVARKGMQKLYHYRGSQPWLHIALT